MQVENPQRTIFYAIEKAIKTYRTYSQRNLDTQGFDITIDQLLVLRAIQDYPGISQTEISQMVFKDYASITRMIQLMVQKGHLKRAYHESDRRRHSLIITKLGGEVLEKLNVIIAQNRATALAGISQDLLEAMSLGLEKIIQNCSITVESVGKQLT